MNLKNISTKNNPLPIRFPPPPSLLPHLSPPPPPLSIFLHFPLPIF